MLAATVVLAQNSTATLPAAPAAKTTAPAATAAAAPGTSTVSTAQVAPKKKWGLSLLNESTWDAEGIKKVQESKISTLNAMTASYKITDTEKIGLKQYFTFEHDPEVDFDSKNIKQDFTILTLSTKIKGILGSDDIAPMFWYYLPTNSAMMNNWKKEMDHFYGLLRMDAEIVWTINPKWSVSYYLNPRQSLGAKDPEAKNFEATSRLIHYGIVYYNVSDTIQPYFYMGFDNKMSSERLTSTSDTFLTALGASATFFDGKLTLNPEISTSTALKQGGEAVEAPRFYQSDEFSYVLSTIVAL